MVGFKGFSGLLSDFPVLFKANLIFKDFSRKPSKFKYFSSLCQPCILNLLKELGKGDKMLGLPSILSLFCNKFDKFNNTGARILDYISKLG